MQKRLAVIIPGFKNPEQWWRRSVASVLSAIGPSDEIVCVDDGSPVRPPLDEIAAQDDRVRALYLPTNVGLSAARNAALDVVNSRYVAFVDSDDEVLPDAYEKTISYMSETDSAVGVFGVKVVWVDEKLGKYDIPEKTSYGALCPDAARELYDKCLLNYAWNKVYDVERISKALSSWNFRFEKGGMPCEDIIFNLQVAMTGVKWCSVDVVGYVYYRTWNTLLSRYKPTNGTGNRLAARAWDAYCKKHSIVSDMFDQERHWTERQQAASDWANIWMPGTPYSFFARYQWLKEHKELGGLFFFLKTVIRRTLRAHFYFRPIRQWHIRRLYPNSELLA